MGPLKTANFQAPSGATLAFTQLGFGGASLGLEPEVQSDDQAAELAETAWQLGIRYFDVAPMYGWGVAERRLGVALKPRPRDSYTLSTKAGRLLKPGAETWRDTGGGIADWPIVYDYSYDGIMRSHELSLARLGLDRADILYVHDIDAKVHGSREAAEGHTRDLFDKGGWRALSELRRSGAVRAIGVGVNEWQPCARVLELGDPDLFLLAGRYTLLEQEPLDTLLPACLKRGVGIVVGGPLNAGSIMGGPLYDYAPAPEHIKARVAAIAGQCRLHNACLLDTALQFIAAHPAVVSILTGAADAGELRRNAEALTNPPPPAAVWSALKASGLLHPDAPTPHGG